MIHVQLTFSKSSSQEDLGGLDPGANVQGGPKLPHFRPKLYNLGV